MSKRTYNFFFFDIFIAILKIEQTTKNFSKAIDLYHSYLSWDSVIRSFEIIGESVKNLIKVNLLDESNRVIVDFRNLLVHHYFGIDPEEVWNVVKDDLSDFKKMILHKIQIIDIQIKNELIDSFIKENGHLEFIVIELKKL